MAKSLDHIKKEFLNSLSEGDRHNCYNLIHEQLNNKVPIKELYENVMKPALYEMANLGNAIK